MKDRPPPNASEYTKWLKEKVNLELTIADAIMRIPAYERRSIISQIPTSLSLTRVGLTLFKNSISVPPFNPLVLGGLALWLDAADSASLTLSGSSVTRWNDKSGNGFNMSNNASFKSPTYNTTGFNGNPTIQFSRASASSFTILENRAFSFTSNSFSLFFASQITQTVGTSFQRFFSAPYIVGGSDSFTSEPFNINTGTANNQIVFQRGTGGLSSTTLTLTNPFIGEVVVNGNNFNIGRYNPLENSVYANGRLLNSSINPTAGSNFRAVHFRIGSTAASNPSADNGFETLQGNMSEVLLFNRSLTTSESQQVEGYLAWKWGLQASLPSNHPYFNVKP